MLISTTTSLSLLPLTSLALKQRPRFPLPSSVPRRPFDRKENSSRLRCNAQLLADLAPATSVVYGALLLGGGVVAYARSGSKGSILGGISGAALMAAAYYLMQSPETKGLADALGFGSAILFSAVFGIRLAATRKSIPSGLLLGLSVGALVVFFSAYMQDRI